jgi:CelD/BcsL family acetyltransferase involved in cellulose biosynthesis
MPSPRLELPASFDDLLASVSRNLRSQLGRRRRALEREGELRLRTVTGGDDLAAALEEVLRLEASGWKGRAGSAISSDPATSALYRGFAVAAAREGWLRLHLLELDGRPVAADIGIAHAGVGYLLKTGFDEAWSRHSPGSVLRAEVLRASIEEGLQAYEFLGGAETYKMQWGPVPRVRAEVHALRGAATAPAWAWWAVVRPRVRPLAQRALRHRESAARPRRAAGRAAPARPGTPPAAPDRGG